MPEDIQSRFTVYPRPDANPGRCIVCGATQRPVVDFGVDIEWADLGFGRAYFCEYCIKQAASKFAPAPIIAAPQITEEEFNNWKLELANGLHTHISNFIPSPEFVPVYGTPDSVPEQTESEDATGIERDEPESDNLTVETDKPSGVKRSLSLPSDPDDGFAGLFNVH